MKFKTILDVIGKDIREIDQSLLKNCKKTANDTAHNIGETSGIDIRSGKELMESDFIMKQK